MNSISISGNLGKDCETRALPTGDMVCNFSIADNQGRDKPSLWWNCGLFGKRAESLAPYLTKGQTVTVIGNVTEREWTDKEGNKRKTMEVRVQDIALQGGKRDNGVSDGQPQRGKHERMAEQPSDLSDMDDDIPF